MSSVFIGLFFWIATKVEGRFRPALRTSRMAYQTPSSKVMLIELGQCWLANLTKLPAFVAAR
jgi:hypothetical protein